jgi:hypothetical protein
MQFYDQYPLTKIDAGIRWIDYKNGEPFYEHETLDRDGWFSLKRVYTYELSAFGTAYTIKYYESELRMEINSNVFPLELQFYADDRIHGFWVFEYKTQKYLSFMGQYNSGNAWAPWLIFIFDITNNDDIKFTVFDTFVFTREPEIGIYSDKLCIVRTTFSNRADDSRYSRLYTFENGIFQEIFDENGNNIELYFDWHRHTYDSIKIYDKNIP